MADLLDNALKKARALKLIHADEFRALSSDSRFEHLFEQLRAAKPKPRSGEWRADGSKAVKVTETDGQLTLNFNKAAVPKFGAFVEKQLDRLYEEFLKENEELEP
ncbi:plasmid partitioning protein RepB C-terminal domain-containing protein [Shinella sp.]|uniref:plasmid partitioning protein RepB C-terminal domain-containing protein n=1 Tax=Shinella sp. TaxID=1870904 RepID=UPI003F6F9837